MTANPFKPTAGKLPPILIGRQAVLDAFREGLENGAGAPERLMLISGNRGYGKTVMLTELRRIALDAKWAVVSDTAAPGLCERLVSALKAKKPLVDNLSIAPTVSVPGIFSASLGKAELAANSQEAIDLREAVDRRLKGLPKGKGILFTIDESQAASAKDLMALATTFQHVLSDQDLTGLPDTEQHGIALALAALPPFIDELLNNDVLTFLRRAKTFMLQEVPTPEVRDAYADTFRSNGKRISAELALKAATAAGGHPYMVQLIGYHAWRAASRREADEVNERDLQQAMEDSLTDFYAAVNAPLYRNLRSPQRLFIEAMAADESGVSNMSDIIERSGRTQSWASKYRASLIQERVIEPAGHGQVRFAVPHLGDYLRDVVICPDDDSWAEWSAKQWLR